MTKIKLSYTNTLGNTEVIEKKFRFKTIGLIWAYCEKLIYPYKIEIK